LARQHGSRADTEAGLRHQCETHVTYQAHTKKNAHRSHATVILEFSWGRAASPLQRGNKMIGTQHCDTETSQTTSKHAGNVTNQTPLTSQLPIQLGTAPPKLRRRQRAASFSPGKVPDHQPERRTSHACTTRECTPNVHVRRKRTVSHRSASVSRVERPLGHCFRRHQPAFTRYRVHNHGHQPNAFHCRRYIVAAATHK
jgi:hypothetical protein